MIDGRNRDRACEIAGIEPAVVVEGDDPKAYIIASKKMREPLAVLGGNVLPGFQFCGAKVPRPAAAGLGQSLLTQSRRSCPVLRAADLGQVANPT